LWLESFQKEAERFHDLGVTYSLPAALLHYITSHQVDYIRGALYTELDRKTFKQTRAGVQLIKPEGRRLVAG
jgi:hypothetical protein